jgi:hypothetical protein
MMSSRFEEGSTLTIKKNFVTFYSPGTFFAETSENPVEAWDLEKAKEMARSIKERHGATPYGFRFITRGRTDKDLDSKEIAHSPMYYLGGKVETLAEVKARATDKDRILISNMECNGYDRIITSTTGYKWSQALGKDDVVLEF